MYQLNTEAARLPVTLAELRAELKVDSDNIEDNALMAGLIRTATQACENYTGLCLITQTWTLWLDRFPASRNDDWWDGVRQGALSELTGCKRFIEIGKAPVQSVTYLKTYDDSDVSYTFSSSSYQVDTVSKPARLSLRNSATWPTTVLRGLNGIEIKFIAGYGDNESSVPQALRAGILKLCVHLYENREQISVMTGGNLPNLPWGIEALWNPYRVLCL